MKEVVFSAMVTIPSSGASPGMGDAFFEPFTRHHQAKVKELHIEWRNSWNELVQFGLSSHGPDISEVGTTWLGSFHTMEALRPLTMGEVALLGGESNFPPASWQACQLEHSNLMLAVPWILDLRVVLYRRDWLQKAGVDETTAFADPSHFAETLRRLKAAGHSTPLGLTTAQTYTRVIHDMACWVWSAGGDLRSADGRQMMLMDLKSRAGMEAYFGLAEFLPPGMGAMIEEDVTQTFLDGKTAVAVVGPSAYLGVVANNTSLASPEVVANTGMAMLMQVPWIGGTALTIWRHASNYQDALRLMQHLTSMESWRALSPTIPAHLGALEKSPLAATPFYPAVQKSLKQGRSFHSGYRWRGVETHLVLAVEQMWGALYANPELNIAHEVEQRFSAVCNRLEQTILAFSR